MPGRGPASISRTRPWAVRWLSEGGELGGVAAEAFHLVHGEDDAAVRGVGLDLAGERERGLPVGAAPDPGADPLGGDLVPGDAVPGGRVDVGLPLSRRRPAAGVTDAAGSGHVARRSQTER